MKTRLPAGSIVCGLLAALIPGLVAAERLHHPSMTSLERDRAGVDPSGSFVFFRDFEEDPRLDPAAAVAGAALDRLEWQVDLPAYPGDEPGSLRAVYDSSLPAGWFGFRLPRSLTEGDTFTAAAAFVIASEGFSADPNGFFQIAWGLWNQERTGFDRTGDFESFASDTFELIEFAWFPNLSPYFGGPFLAPAVFGTDLSGDAFANFTSLFGLEVALPLDVPLLAVLEHRPEVDALVVAVYRIVDSDHVVPIDGAVGVAPLDGLSLREYEVDALGLALWNDGFGGAAPALIATLDFHRLAAVAGRVGRPEAMLAFGGSDDDEDDDEDDDDEDDDHDED